MQTHGRDHSLPAPINKVIDAFASLPGIGPKTASRLTYYLLRSPDELTLFLAEALSELKENTRFCSTCYNITETDPCSICANDRRE
jgi:recombination protein RecR